MKGHTEGDVRVHEALSRVARHVGLLVADLGLVRDLLDSGAGEPVGGQLTPTEFDYLAHHLGRVGLAGAQLMADDLARTHAREGSEWPESAPPRPPRRKRPD